MTNVFVDEFFQITYRDVVGSAASKQRIKVWPMIVFSVASGHAQSSTRYPASEPIWRRTLTPHVAETGRGSSAPPTAGTVVSGQHHAGGRRWSTRPRRATVR